MVEAIKEFARASGPRGLPRRAWASSRPLSFVGAAMLLVLGVAVVGLLLDERVITGAPAWLKPMKFAVSISIYCSTLLWMLTFVRGRSRLVALICWVSAIALFVEMVLIAGAAALGTTSHFNVSTPTHAAVWYTMAGFVALVWAMNLLAAVLLLIQRMPDPAFAWALRLGILVSVGERNACKKEPRPRVGHRRTDPYRAGRSADKRQRRRGNDKRRAAYRNLRERSGRGPGLLRRQARVG